MQHFGQAEQLFALALHQLLHRDAGPAGHNAADLFGRHAVTQQALLLLVGSNLFFGFQLALQVGQFAVLQLTSLGVIAVAGRLFNFGLGASYLGAQALHLIDGVLLVLPLSFLGIEGIAQFGHFFFDGGKALLGHFIGFFLQRSLLDLQLGDLMVQVIQLCGHGVQLGLDHCAGFIHQVDGFIRQETVGNITVRQRCCRNQSAILNFNTMVHLIALFQATQDGDGILHRGLLHHNGLETAFQSGVFLDILAVLVQGGGANAVQLTAGQHRL